MAEGERSVEIIVVNNGIIVKDEALEWVYPSLPDLFRHAQLEIGDHFILTIKKLPREE